MTGFDSQSRYDVFAGCDEVVNQTLADVAQLVVRHLAKVKVAGSNPVVRSMRMKCYGSTSVFQTEGGGSTPPIRTKSERCDGMELLRLLSDWSRFES